MKRLQTFQRIVSLLITVALAMGWSSLLPPKFDNVPKAQATQKTITTALLSTVAEQNASPNTVFTTNLIGYTFYVSSTGTSDVRYSKTTDGGETWSTVVDLSGTGFHSVAVWYDQWTPGDSTGTKIYMAAIGEGADNLSFKMLDTSNDSLSPTGTTWTTIFNGTTWTAASSTGASVCKSTDGHIFATASTTGSATTLDVHKSLASDTAHTTWATTTSGLDVTGDFNQVLPVGLAGDVLLLNHDISGNQLRSNVYDEATDAWSGFSNRIAATENATYDGSFGAALNKVTGEVYVAINNNPAVLNGDINTARVVSDGTTNVTWSNTTDAYTNISTAGGQATMAIDWHNGDVYCFYIRGTMGSSVNIYYRKSTDQGATWSAESAAVSSGAGNYQQVYVNMTSPYKIFVSWEDTTATDLFGVNYADITALDIADARMMLFYDGASVPAGWSSLSAAAGDIFYQKFPRGGAVYGNAGGANTHDHTATIDSVSAANVVLPANAAGTAFAIATHTHTYVANSDALSILPTYRELQVIQYDAGIPNDVTAIPANAIAIFDTAVMPSGWTQLSAQDDHFVRGGPDGEADPGNATSSHTHSVSYVGGLDTITGVGTAGANAPTYSARVHSHSISNQTTASGDFLPLNIDIVLGQNGGSAGPIPGGMLAMFTMAPSGSWVSQSGSGEDFYQRYFEAKTSYAAAGGGATTHTHAGLRFNTPASATTSLTDKVVGAIAAGSDHVHEIATSFSTTDNLPTYVDTLVYKSPAYNPQTRHWRWYADEEDATPGTAYAAEDTATPAIEMGKNVRLKLRINISNTGGAAEDNSRKKLQFTTDISNWIDVAATSATTTDWRYFNGGGDDNVTLPPPPPPLLTDSSTTTRGIHNESSSDSPSYSDHPADTVVEFEYCIEGYAITAGTAYIFRLYDQVSAAVIPPESGQSNPTLRAGSPFALVLDGPSEVALGSWQLGSGGFYQYDFVGGEGVTCRDLRGLTTGNSSGWTLSVDVTTPLAADTLEIDPGDMTWITNAITGLYDASTAGINGEAGAAMDVTVAAIIAAEGGYQGLGSFTILPSIRINNAPGLGNYKGSLTLTLV